MSGDCLKRSALLCVGQWRDPVQPLLPGGALGVDEQADVLFDDPADNRLVPAAEYLSGNVRDKLDQAREAAATNPALEVNVRALTEVVPEPIGMEDIRARLGAVWIDRPIQEQFLRETLDDPQLTVTNPMPGVWKVKGDRHSLKATNEWGTERRPATELAERLMSQSAIRVDDENDDGKKIPNPVETQAALDKAEELNDRFAEWVWENPERAARLQERYNRQFNSLVLRDYSTAGEALTLPGLAGMFTLGAHQKAAVARMVAEPAVGLFHEVGAGKTLEMVAGTMELKRLQMITKPAVVVPNHMLAQFTREWLQAYPTASLLAASSKDLSGAPARRRFVARAAAGDWDAIIMTQEAFKAIGVSPETQETYLKREMGLLKVRLTFRVWWFRPLSSASRWSQTRPVSFCRGRAGGVGGGRSVRSR